MFKVQPEAPTASPAPREQRTSTFLHVETMNDLDDGRSTLVTATENNLGDLRETSPARALGMVADARAQLDRIEQLIKEYEARDTLAAIVAENDLTLEEWAMDGLDPKFRNEVMAWYGEIDGKKIVAVPQGQNPAERLHAVHQLVTHLDRT